MPYISVSSEVLQQLQFSQGPLSQNLFAEDIGDLFDRNTLAGRVVLRGATEVSFRSTVYASTRSAIPDNSISTLPELFGHIVSL